MATAPVTRPSPCTVSERRIASQTLASSRSTGPCGIDMGPQFAIRSFGRQPRYPASCGSGRYVYAIGQPLGAATSASKRTPQPRSNRRPPMSMLYSRMFSMSALGRTRSGKDWCEHVVRPHGEARNRSSQRIAEQALLALRLERDAPDSSRGDARRRRVDLKRGHGRFRDLLRMPLKGVRGPRDEVILTELDRQARWGVGRANLRRYGAPPGTVHRRRARRPMCVHVDVRRASAR